MHYAFLRRRFNVKCHDCAVLQAEIEVIIGNRFRELLWYIETSISIFSLLYSTLYRNKFVRYNLSSRVEHCPSHQYPICYVLWCVQLELLLDCRDYFYGEKTSKKLVYSQDELSSKGKTQYAPTSITQGVVSVQAVNPQTPLFEMQRYCALYSLPNLCKQNTKFTF